MPSKAAAKKNPNLPGLAGIPEVILKRMGFLLNRVALRQKEIVERVLKPYGLVGKHLGILLLIEDRGSLPQQEIGKCISIDRTTMVAMVDDLEKLGYVERKAHPTDRRAHALYLTAKGREVLPKLYRLGMKAEEELLKPLDARDRRELGRILRRLVLAHDSGAKT